MSPSVPQAAGGAASTPDAIGSGWPFPVEATATGAVPLVTGGDKVDGALHFLLSTAPGERVMRPDFGCAIWELLFAPLNATTLGAMESAVRRAVARWEPRVDLEAVDVVPDPDRSAVVVEVRYRLRASNDRRNLVHPYYLIADEPTSALAAPPHGRRP